MFWLKGLHHAYFLSSTQSIPWNQSLPGLPKYFEPSVQDGRHQRQVSNLYTSLLVYSNSHFDHTHRIAQLLTSSAWCSKQRQFSLEQFTASVANAAKADKAPVHQATNTAKYVSDPEAEQTEVGKGKRKAVDEFVCVKEELDHALGWSSSQPLRLRSSERLRRGRIRVEHFAGDRQPSTAISMAHLYGAHPTPVLVNSVSVTADAAPSSSSGSAQHVTTTSSEPAGRLVYADNDEDATLAGVDAELPAPELLQYIKGLAATKVAARNRAAAALAGKARRIGGHAVVGMGSADSSQACAGGVADEDNADGTAAPGSDKQNSSSGRRSSLMGRFDESAAIAVGVVVEELVRDMMLQWYKSGTPLGFEPRALRTEALAQMRDAPDPKAITAQLLRKRLEVSACIDMQCTATRLLFTVVLTQTRTPSAAVDAVWARPDRARR
jgi:hypothetical protein